MHYGFILKLQLSNGSIWHMPWQRQGGSKREVEKAVKASFDQDNIFAPGEKQENPATLIEIIEAGECEDGIDNSQKLFEDIVKKAVKLDAKAIKQDSVPSAS